VWAYAYSSHRTSSFTYKSPERSAQGGFPLLAFLRRGLALLVAVANSGLDGLGGEAFRSATTDGLRTAMLLAAAGIAATAPATLGLRRPSAREVGGHEPAKTRPAVHV
jgi:hypothetical protein